MTGFMICHVSEDLVHAITLYGSPFTQQVFSRRLEGQEVFRNRVSELLDVIGVNDRMALQSRFSRSFKFTINCRLETSPITGCLLPIG